MKNRRFLTIFLCLAAAGYAQGYSPEYDQNGRLSILRADLNRDGYFNMVDISFFASAWLEQDCGLSNSCEGADNFPEVGDGTIDFRDYSVFAGPQGLCVDAENPDCIHAPLTLFEPPSAVGELVVYAHGKWGDIVTLQYSINAMEPAEESSGSTWDKAGPSGFQGGGGAGYHWRARPVDSAGIVSGWVDRGGGESGLGGNRQTLALGFMEFSSSSWARRLAIDTVRSHMRVNGPEEFVEPAGEVAESLISLPEKGSASKLNLFSGEVCESAVDLHIASRGPDFVWQRVYRSRTGPNTVMGNGWDFSYNIYLEQDGGNLIVHNGCGRRDPYYPEPNGIWAADGFFREVAQEDDLSFTLTFPHKGTWKFHPLDEPNAPGKISAITDRNGNSLTFDYDSLGRLSIIHDTLDTADNSRDITIAYNADSLIESVTDWTGREVTYEYYNADEPNGCAGDLKSATSPVVRDTPTGNDFLSGKTTTYTYTKGFGVERLNHNLLTITDPKGQVYLQNTYGTDPAELSFDHVTQLILGNPNDKIDITYMRQVPDANNNNAVTRSVANDRMGNVTEHFYDNWNRLVILRQYTGRADPNLPTSIDPNVNMPTGKLRSDDPPFFETRFQYNNDFLPTRTDYPNSNYVTNVYESDLEPNAPPRSRGNLRELHRFAGSLEAVSDQNEITALFEYDPNVNNGTNRVTRYVGPRGFETLYDYDPNGNRILSEHVRPADSNITYEWQYNGYGQVTAQVLPDNGSGDQRRDEYTYYAIQGDPNYGYLKDVIVDEDNLALTTTFEYDQVGNIRRIIDPRGHDTQFIVNQLNQVVRSISREVTDSSGVRYQCDIYYDEKDNIVQVDVQNKNEEGELQPNTHLATAFEYDILNYLTRTTSEVDPWNLIITEYEYDDNRNLSLVRFGEAANGNQPENVVRTLYDERDMVFKVTRAESDPNQSSTQYDYDGNGNLIRVSQGTEGTPNVTTYGYDGFDRRTSIIDPMGNESTTTMDNAGNVIIDVLLDGTDMVGDTNNVRLYESSYEYDGLNRLIRSIVLFFDPNTQAPIGDGNSITQFFYSDNSQVTKITDDNGNEISFEYDTGNRLREVTDAKENTVTYSYDENSNITALTEVEKSDLGEPNETFVTAYQYDNLNRLVSITDNNDNSTTYAYDSRGNLVQLTNALNNESRYEYDGLNRLIQTVRDMDGDGADPGDANDIVTSQSWDDSSRLVSQTDDNGNTTQYEWDALAAQNWGRMVEAGFGPSIWQHVTESGRDRPGAGGTWPRVSMSSSSWGNDGSGIWGNVVGSTIWGDFVGSTIWGNFVGPTIWANVVGSTIWGNFVGPTIWGNLGPTTIWGGASGASWGRVSGASWGRVSGAGWGRRVKTTYADGTATEHVYDVHDNITQSTDAMGSVVDSNYDLLNRLTSNAITPGLGVSSDTTFENYKYDGLSRVVYAEDDDSVVTLAYDSLSNVTAETLNGQTTTSVHDGLGNKLSCTYPSGRVITCTYDELNRKKTISDTAGQIASYDYFGPARVERRSFRNNTVCDYSHDDVKRITATTHVFDPCGADTVIDSRTYTWDKMYNKTQRKDVRTGGPQLTHDYTYDAANRLINTIVTDAVPQVVRDTDYALDGVGNRTEVTGSPDPGSYTMDSNTPEPADFQMNQYTTTPFDSRSYDKNGNLVTIDDGERTQKDIRYDYRNQMVEVNDANAYLLCELAAGALLGRPIAKECGAGNGDSGGRLYTYDLRNVIEEANSSAATLATYLYGNYIDEVLSMQRDSNDYYYHTDDLFNVMAVTDACGLVVERYEYGDYGEPNFFDSSGGSIGASAIGNPYLFTGRRYDLETGWYNYGNRYFDSTAGRFITRDNSVIIPPIWIRPIPTGTSMQAMMLQNRISRLCRVLTLLTNIMKRHHDTTTGIIHNLK